MFGPVEDRGVSLSGDVWSSEEKLNDTDRENFSRRFIEEDVNNVVDQMEKTNHQALMGSLSSSWDEVSKLSHDGGMRPKGFPFPGAT
jgi:hypothetical protein